MVQNLAKEVQREKTARIRADLVFHEMLQQLEELRTWSEATRLHAAAPTSRRTSVALDCNALSIDKVRLNAIHAISWPAAMRRVVCKPRRVVDCGTSV